MISPEQKEDSERLAWKNTETTVEVKQKSDLKTDPITLH